MATQRRFSRKLKVKAIKLITERSVVGSQAIRDLAGQKVRLYWIRVPTHDSQQAFPNKGAVKSAQIRIDKLFEWAATLKIEHDILKGAAIYIALP
jgi:transposase-like protein